MPRPVLAGLPPRPKNRKQKGEAPRPAMFHQQTRSWDGYTGDAPSMSEARMALLPAPFGPWIKLMFGPKSTRSRLCGGRREQRARLVEGSMAADAACRADVDQSTGALTSDS